MQFYASIQKMHFFAKKQKNRVQKMPLFGMYIYEGRIFPKMKGVVSMKKEIILKGGRHFFQNFL